MRSFTSPVLSRVGVIGGLALRKVDTATSRASSGR